MAITNPITVRDIMQHLVGLDAYLQDAANSKAQYDSAKIESLIPARIRDFERQCQVRINPVQCVVYPDGTYDGENGLDADGTREVIVDRPYDYYKTEAIEFFRITLRNRPVQQVQRCRLMWNTDDTIFTFPSDWLRWNDRAGTFHIMPYRGAALASGAALAYTQIGASFGYRDYVPGIICVDYIAGLPSGWETTREWADVKRAVEEYCAYGVLCDIGELYDAGLVNKSIGADGLSQSWSYDRFQRRKEELLKTSLSVLKELAVQEAPIFMGAV